MQYTTLPLLLLLVIALLARCAEPDRATRGEDASTDTGTSPAASSAASRSAQIDSPAFIGTRDTTYVAAEASAAVLLTEVRVAQREGYDRIVFEFEGDDMPGYAVEYVPEATHCASGYPVDVEASNVLRVQIAPAIAHEFDEAGARHSTVDSSEQLTGFEAITHSRLMCDHHGGVEWAIGTSGERPYRSQMLRQPTRIVVDVLRP